MEQMKRFLKNGFVGILATGLLVIVCGTFYAQFPTPVAEKRTGTAPLPDWLRYKIDSVAFWGELAKLGIRFPPSTGAANIGPAEKSLHAALRPWRPLKGFLLSFLAQDWIGRVYAAHGNTFTNRINIDTPTDWIDAESTFIAQTVGTNDYSVVGWMKEISFRDDPENPGETLSTFRLYRAVHKTGEADWNRNFMPMPTDQVFTNSVDPVLAENLYSDGAFPKRMYYVGLFHLGTFTDPPQRVGVYYADEPYQTWSGPFTVEQNNSASFFLDKPDIWVSEWTPTRGHVYVVYAKTSNTGGPSEIKFSKSTNGGVTWSTPVVVATRFANGAQVLVNPTTQRIYVCWSNFQSNTIEMSQSDDQGVTWTNPETATSANLFDGSELINGRVRATTVLQARFNWVAEAIGLVFHEQEGTSLVADVYIVRKTTGGWQQKQLVNQGNTVRDQWCVGVDYDPNGQWLVGFYDRSGDPNNIRYKQTWARLQANGTFIEQNTVLDVVATDPTDNRNHRFVGDYQDVWWWNYPNHPNIENEFLIAYPQLDTQGEMFVSGVH